MNNVQTPTRCRFCGIAAGDYGADYDIPTTLSEGYFSIASIGAFIPGWSLVCPRRHVHNLSGEYRLAVFQEEISKVCKAVKQSFGDSAIFEHGSNDDASPTACGTGHAHLHVVPYAGSITELIFSQSLDWRPVRLESLSVAVGGSEYLFAADRYEGADTRGYYAILRTPRSQFFRQLIAAHTGVPHLADYRTAPQAHISALTALRVRAAANAAPRHAA